MFKESYICNKEFKVIFVTRNLKDMDMYISLCVSAQWSNFENHSHCNRNTTKGVCTSKHYL